MSDSGDHPSRTVIAAVSLLACAAGCDASVTSVGAWERASQAGEAGAAGLYLEAEEGELSGFEVIVDTAASNAAYIQAPAGPASDSAPEAETPSARYRFDLAQAGDYLIWGRIHSPDVSRNRFWFQVDGGAWQIWRITVGEIWFWDDLHVDTNYDEPLHFALSASPHELTIAKAASLAELDRLYITAEGAEPPGNDTPCNPPHSIDRGGGVCAPSCGSLAPTGMHTSCRPDVCEGQPTLEVYDCDVCCVVP